MAKDGLLGLMQQRDGERRRIKTSLLLTSTCDTIVSFEPLLAELRCLVALIKLFSDELFLALSLCVSWLSLASTSIIYLMQRTGGETH